MPAASDLYLDLLIKSLTYSLWGETHQPFDWSSLNLFHRVKYRLLAAFLARRTLKIEVIIPFDAEKRRVGRDWPVLADTMIGEVRLQNLRSCVEDVLARNVAGDLIETGVWRGGATILMRAILRAHGVTDRTVWVADSFAGCPPPNVEKYPADEGDRWHAYKFLSVPRQDVEQRFAKYGLLDSQVRFLEGWFKDTLPAAPIQSLAVLRIDGDLYESTTDALVHLYPKVTRGGYIIVDDYALSGCRKAVDDFRAQHGIETPIQTIDWTGIFWQRA